jgi:hypothetical protein
LSMEKIWMEEEKPSCVPNKFSDDD